VARSWPGQVASDFKWTPADPGFADLPTLTHFMGLTQNDPHSLANALIDAMFHTAPDKNTRDVLFDEITRVPECIASAILFDQTLRDYGAFLETVSLPTLVCAGRHDALCPAVGMQDVAKRIRNARYLELENSGHCMFIEESHWFNQAVREFSARL
jgi:non-heme chloroperoxidase